MQPTRRRKKRPNYGIRTVEVCRGKNGFGFTISGQQPCILSCIVPNSPAEQAGLRPGDYLIAVCGQNVSKVPHDDVVQMIGNCRGILKLQIAENYYSDSSEEDFITTFRQKPKYPHKYKNNGHNTHPFIHKSYKFGNNAIDNYSFEEKFETVKSANDNGVLLHNGIDPVSLSSQNYINAGHSEDFSETNCVFQCIVGYLGTIEMPKKLTPVSRQQIVRGCIKRLRAEKRNCSSVMMTVFPCSLRLKNDTGTTIAVYPGGRVTYCSASNELNKKYFGIVTTCLSEEPSNSCHVFVMLNVSHQEHANVAIKYGVNCNASNPDSADCSHFPANCDPIVNAIRKYYEDQRNDNDLEEPLVANSPQPSNDSSVTTSNSDSGIGFRDDCGHQSDRILVVDIQNQRLHIQASGQSDPQYIDCCADKSISRNNTSVSSPPSLHSTEMSNKEKSCENFANNFESHESVYHWNTKMCKDGSTDRLSRKSFDNITASISTEKESLERRLNPKVFNNMYDVFPVSHSLEDLKTQSELYEDLEPSDSFMKKHSLQDLTVFSSCMNPQEKIEQCEPIESERKATSWATSLEKLLNDTVGLHAFAEFLKKEFSVENAYFWAACEKYRRSVVPEERKKLAQYIYEKFLSNSATDPVNVDSTGKHLTQQQVQNADVNLLQNAQKQIFNLLKFDSYPRFLKSDLYKHYLTREISGECITLPQETIDPDLVFVQTVQISTCNKKNTEESDRSQRSNRRRRSLLPWTRSRCKSRDRTVSNENLSSAPSGSHTSLASWDLAVPVSLCRVMLPDASSAVLNIQQQETVHYLISKLLEKRTIPYNTFQVTLTATDKVVNLEENASVLAGKEIRVELRIEFRLDLPDRTSLTVKSKPSHTLGAVLGPILIKHGYNLHMVTLCLMSENEVLEPNTLVSVVSNQRVQVLTRSTPTPNLQGWSYYGCNTKPKQATTTLDEITNRVFEELLQGKAENFRNPVNENVSSKHAHPEDWSSENSSKIVGKFLRKVDSFHQEKHRRSKKYSEAQNNLEKKFLSNKIPPVIAKLKPASKFEKDGLYEGIKRCQRGRLEDQRGTEIKMELPDFLKDKENTPNGRKKLKKILKEVEAEHKISSNKETKEQNVNFSKITDTYRRTPAADFKNDDNVYANDVLNFAPPNANVGKSSSSLFKEPPPLPPKPKNIAWRASNAINCNIDHNSTSVYLDQPTSSFV